MNKKLILEFNLNLFQKIHMLFIFVVGLGLQFIFNKIDFPEKKGFEFLVNVIFILFEIGILILILSKNGLIINEKGLFKAYFFSKISLFKYYIDLTGKSKISIFEIGKSQNLPSISIIYPSSSQSFKTYDLYILNNNHTIKYEIISLNIKENAQKCVDLLSKQFNLKLEKYNPEFRK